MTDCKFFEELELDQVFPTYIRGVSEDYFSSSFFNVKLEQLELPQVQPQIEEVKAETAQQSSVIPEFNKYTIPKESKPKPPSKQKKDYRKNICGYITKKIVRQFVSPAYKEKVLSLCDKHGCQYQQCNQFYYKKIERITGPTHLDMLLNVSKQAGNIKKCFKQFFIWFLRHRYLRYLIMEGKMEKKDIYIDYKNKTLLFLGSIDEENELFMHEIESSSKQTSSIYPH